MAKKSPKPRTIIVDSKLLETVGYLGAAPEGTTYCTRFFEGKGLLEAFNTLRKLGMIDENKENHLPYTFNNRGREYAAILVQSAVDISNKGRENVNFRREKLLGALEISLKTFAASPVKIDYRK